MKKTYQGSLILVLSLSTALILGGVSAAMADTTYTIPSEAPTYGINPAASGVDNLEAFIETPGVSFGSTGFTNLDSGWSSTTISPTYAVEYGTISSNLTEDLDLATVSSSVTVDLYAFTGCTTQPTSPCSSADLTDAYQVTFSNGSYVGFTALPASALTSENTATTVVVNPSAITDTAMNVSSTDATLNGTNGAVTSTQSSFWVSTSAFTVASSSTPTVPAGVYSTPLLGGVNAGTDFSASLSSVTGILPVTASTTYYYAAWIEVSGVWYPGAVQNFTTSNGVSAVPVISSISPTTGTIAGGTTVTITGTGLTGATAVNFGLNAGADVVVLNDNSVTVTSPAGTGTNDITIVTPGGSSATSTADQFSYVLTGTVTGAPGILAVTSITPVQSNGISDNSFADGWSYLFNITVPTDQPNLAMQFADWLDAGNSATIPAAGDIEISSAQASNTSTVLISAANTYSSPVLDMIGNLSTSTPGLHVQVLVQVKIPVGSTNGSYSTTYGVQTTP